MAKPNKSGIDWKDKAQRAAYMRRYNVSKTPVLDHHLWDHVTDTCERCGLRRKRKAILSKPGRFKDWFWVNKGWTDERPTECRRREGKAESE